MPPITDSVTLSVNSCRTMRPRPAPIAARSAISRLRAVARTSRRLATFAHAISSTKPTAPPRISSVGLHLLTKTVCIGSRPKPPPSPSAFGNFGREFRAGELEPRLPLLERHTALEPRRGREEVALIDRVRIELERHPELRRLANLGEIEVGADDADHFVRIAAQQNRLADDVGIAAETPLPTVHG